MADYCLQCSLEIFGKDFRELAGLSSPEDTRNKRYALAICEGCGPIQVDHDGWCVSDDCSKRHGEHIDTLIREANRRDIRIPALNKWVHYPGIRIYARVGRRVINGTLSEHVIDLASLEADHPGRGAFKKLLEHFQFVYPDYEVHVENVHTEKFQGGLKRLGFEPTDTPLCFLLRKEAPKTPHRTGL